MILQGIPLQGISLQSPRYISRTYLTQFGLVNNLEPLWKSDAHCTSFSTTFETVPYKGETCSDIVSFMQCNIWRKKKTFCRWGGGSNYDSQKDNSFSPWGHPLKWHQCNSFTWNVKDSLTTAWTLSSRVKPTGNRTFDKNCLLVSFQSLKSVHLPQRW